MKVELTGLASAEDKLRKIFAAAIRKCAANAVKYAKDDCLTADAQRSDVGYTFTLCSNWRPPAVPIREAGGPISLRMLAEEAVFSLFRRGEGKNGCFFPEMLFFRFFGKIRVFMVHAEDFPLRVILSPAGRRNGRELSFLFFPVVFPGKFVCSGERSWYCAPGEPPFSVYRYTLTAGKAGKGDTDSKALQKQNSILFFSRCQKMPQMVKYSISVKNIWVLCFTGDSIWIV